jgi:SPOR domain
MRALIILLILANLAFAAWALLIDRPVDAPAARDISRLGKLLLASEPRPAGGNAANVHCMTIGPFNDLVVAASAATVLQTRGFTPTQRDEAGPDAVAYWVYLDNVPSETEANRLLQRLRANGLTDARTMPITATDPTRRVSVGLFNEKGGADRRARDIRRLGLTPVITEQHQALATYWLDLALTTPGQSVSIDGLVPPASAAAPLQIRDCPVAASSAPVSSAPAK